MSPAAEKKSTNTWLTRGFDDFSRGTMGNGGHNLYVSRAGVLQRIHQYDFSGDGYMDLVFCNSQSHLENAPAGVYQDPLGRYECVELPADGAWSGAVLDLNGDGCDDLVLGNWYNGVGLYMNAFVYYGSPEGWSERRHQRLPAPVCTSVAAGDFNGDGRPDLAFLSKGAVRQGANLVRLFYQTELGFEPRRRQDLDLDGDQLGSGDLDGDGCAELIVRSEAGEVTIYWGSEAGIDLNRRTTVPVEMDDDSDDGVSAADKATAEYVQDAKPLVQVIRLGEVPHIFVARARRAFLVPVHPDRRFGTPLVFDCSRALAVAAGDVDGDGCGDLVFACRQPSAGQERSWIYWGSGRGFRESDKTPIPTYRACDVALGDLDGDGCDDIVLCQGHTPDSFTFDSLVYRGSRHRSFEDPLRLATHDGRRVFLARPGGKGLPDVVFVNTRARNKTEEVAVSIYAGGPEGFSAERRRDLPGWGAVSALCCDFDDDGRADLALVNSSHNTPSRDPGSYVFLNGKEGFPADPTWKLPTNLAHGACCADINRDGYLDLVFAGHTSPEILIFYGSAGGFDQENPERIHMEHQGTVYRNPLWIYLADLDNDGWLDLVVPQSREDRSLILWGGPQGFGMERCQMLSVWAGRIRPRRRSHRQRLSRPDRRRWPPGPGRAPRFLRLHLLERPRGNPRGPPYPAAGKRRPLRGRRRLRQRRPARPLRAVLYGQQVARSRVLYLLEPAPDAASRPRITPVSSPTPPPAASPPTSTMTAGSTWPWPTTRLRATTWAGPRYGGTAPRDSPTAARPGCPPRVRTALLCVDPGSIMDRGHQEFYLSAPFELPAESRVERVHWQAETPAKTWVKAQLRFGATRSLLERAEWRGPAGGTTWYDNGQEVCEDGRNGRWIQYRLALGAFNSCGTPRVSEVAVEYSV